MYATIAHGTTVVYMLGGKGAVLPKQYFNQQHGHSSHEQHAAYQ
jgi:hypothetical protein